MSLRAPLVGGRWTPVFISAGLLVAALALRAPVAAYAQDCGLPGTPTCTPQPPEEKPTKTPRPRPTRTPTPTETATPTDTATEIATPTATGVPCNTNVLTAVLTGASEVPPVKTEGQGTVKLALGFGHIAGNWQVSNLSGVITAAHIHNGPAGVNAGVYIPLSGLPPVGGSFATLDGGVAAAKLQAVLNDPQSFYVNVHTSAHPGGEIRGQLACAPAGETVTSPTPTATPAGMADGGGGPGPGLAALALLGVGGFSMGLGLYSLRRSSFPGGVRTSLIVVGALGLLGAILLWFLTIATPPPGKQIPAASPTFDYSQIQFLLPLFGWRTRRQALAGLEGDDAQRRRDPGSAARPGQGAEEVKRR